MPGIDYKLAAMLISNIRNIDRFDSADELTKHAGPVDIIYALMRDRSVYQPPKMTQLDVLKRSG
ncbi:transposase [Halarsenatibacter silvermanii]|uniref:Transposase IS116/IS110/IS902 family protein n=1 Tax=Halarsenatibacter silvermanii TaxID=321763 RepID=A0A1G9IC38_9FIRM|nr:transposase [Halarsenatibacter silvermanii]SDL22767.1 Transposase IS116/IS110/IS902 family protein [Halarsenatibacter silvermanii]